MKTLRIATMFGLLVLSAKGLVFTGKHVYSGAKTVAHVARVVLI